MSDIKVSIICNAFNHEKYIANALDSFIIQKTNFKYEILIHDDASTDNTAAIIRKYEEKYPSIIKAIYQSENQFSKGKNDVFYIQSSRIKGDYIAFCEGDDYWVDEYKLQKQYDAMESNQNIDICTHAAIMIDAKTKKHIKTIEPKRKNTIIPVEEVILGGGGYVATNSIFMRTYEYKKIMEFRKFLMLDYTMQIQGSLKGGMLYIDEKMSNYRFLSEGSWTSRMRNDSKKHAAIYNKIIRMLEILDSETKFKYHRVIEDTISREKFVLLEIKRDYKNIMKAPLFKEQSLLYKVKTVIKYLLKYKQDEGE